MALPSFIYSWAIQFLVGEIASSGKNTDWVSVKAKLNALLVDKVHSKWLDSIAGKDLDLVIDATAAVCQDQPELTALLGDLAAKNWSAAEAVLLAEVGKRLPQLADLLSSLS